MRIPLIINPVAGRGEGRALAEDLVAYLGTLGVDTEPEFSEAPRHAVQLVAAAAEHNDRILVAGGDGTVNEAVNGVMHSHRRPALGIIPVGTGNDFAKMLGLDHDWRAAGKRIASGQRRAVDVGRCNDDYFANGIGVGFDAQVAMEANRIRYLRGTAVYFLALLRTLALRYATPHVTIDYDGGTLRQTITLVAVANGRWYGGAFRIAPAADICDGLLELVVARGLGRSGILRLVPKVMRGTHVGDGAVRIYRATRVSITSEVPLPVHADGELLSGGATRLDIEIFPRALSILA